MCEKEITYLVALLAWNLAIWLPYSKYHGSWLPRTWLFGVPAALGKRGLCAWRPPSYKEISYLAALLAYLAALLAYLLVCWLAGMLGS